MTLFQRHKTGGKSLRRIIYNILDHTALTDFQNNLAKQNKQNKQNRQILGDFVGASSLFIMIFAGLFFVGVFQ